MLTELLGFYWRVEHSFSPWFRHPVWTTTGYGWIIIVYSRFFIDTLPSFAWKHCGTLKSLLLDNVQNLSVFFFPVIVLTRLVSSRQVCWKPVLLLVLLFVFVLTSSRRVSWPSWSSPALLCMHFSSTHIPKDQKHFRTPLHHPPLEELILPSILPSFSFWTELQDFSPHETFLRPGVFISNGLYRISHKLWTL